jgi:voltage-gated potassium channel
LKVNLTAMKRIYPDAIAIWSTVLLVSLIFTIFILPVLPPALQKILLRILYSIIYISAILCLDKRNNPLLVLFFSTLATEWVSGLLGLPALLLVAKLVNVVFFIVIVISLIHQIATARNVSLGVILDSVSGYLLLGLIYSIAIHVIAQNDPGAYSASMNTNADSVGNLNISVPVYFSFVTLATLGYGDITPLEPYTRSLSTFITVSGQFYIAIIVALLVGKFSVQQDQTK